MAASAVIANIAMYVGEDKIFQDTIYQADGTTAQNITGWAISFVMHVYGDPTAVIVTKTVGSGITITDGPGGVLQVLLARADTVDLPAGQYAYVFQRTDSGANIVPTIGLLTLLAR